MASDALKTPQADTAQTAPTMQSEGGAHQPSTRSVQLKSALRAADGYDAQAALLEPVQRHGGGDSAAGVQDAAARGVAGGGGAMPFASQIQDSFGSFDISGVRAHTGGAASDAAKSIGANAYAMGSDVAFGGAPDLHTAAHEAAHTVQQKAGVQLSGGVGKAGDAYEMHADRVADAVVAGKSAEPILAEMAGGGGGGGAVQRVAVQRDPLTSTPRGDAALSQVRASPTTVDAKGKDGAAAPVITVPQSYDAYAAHIRTKFAGKLAEIKALQLKFKQSANGAHAQEQTLNPQTARLAELEAEFKAKRGELSKEASRERSSLKAIAPHGGKTMAELHDEAKALLAKHGSAKIKHEGDKKALEGVMLASITLGGQIDPETSAVARTFYMTTIDKQENARLVTKADAEGLDKAKSAELAVNYRTWARVFVRDEVMDNKHASEILFMRDVGKSGREAGESPKTIIAKVFGRVKKDHGIGADVTFDSATEAQKLLVYQGMIDSAKKTNAAVDSTLTGKK